MSLSLDKWLVLLGEVMEWVSDGGVILDPDVYIFCYTKKGTDIMEVLAGWPVTDFGSLRVVWDPAFIHTLVP